MSKASHERWWIQPPTVGALCGVLAVLMLALSAALGDKPLSAESMLRVVYRAGQLMSLNQDEPDVADHPDQGERIAILVAQVLAVIAVAMLGFEFFRLLGGPAYERLRVLARRIGPGTRVMVIGDGPAANAVVDGLLHGGMVAGKRVLVTLVRPGAIESSPVHPLGALMVVRRQDVSERDLQLLDINGMSRVIVAGESDAANLAQASACVRALQPASGVLIALRINSPECAAQVRSASRASAPDSPLSRVRVFCPDAIASARALSAEGRPPWGQRLLLLGFGASASAFLAEWLCAHPEAECPEIVAIDPRADHALERFRANYQDLAGVARVRTIRDTVHPDLLRHELARLLAGSAAPVAVSVAVGDLDRNLSLALLAVSLAQSGGAVRGQVTVFLRQSLLQEVSALLAAGPHQVVSLRVWGGVDDSFGISAVLGDSWMHS